MSRLPEHPISRLCAPLSARLPALALCLALAACDTVVNVDAGAVVRPRHTNVLVTVREIWFNESAVAVPTDDTWQKIKLDKTVTIDLARVTSGTVARLATELKLPEGTYRQVRVFLSSRDDKLKDSAEALGAKDNDQVTWFDEDDDERTRPLELLNSAQGIGMTLEIKVKEGRAEDADTVQLLFDAARDLTEFRYGGKTGFLLNPSWRAMSATKAGTIRGTLNMPGIPVDSATGRAEVEVTAQKLDKTLHRRVIVGSATVGRTGAFVLYPLPLDEDEKTTEYDLVIHGPRIQTVVIRDVPVSEPEDGVAPTLSGITLQPAESFEVNLRDDQPVTPRGARIGFYQTLPGGDEPYLIEMAPTDPVSGRFAEDLLLSRAERISWGTWDNNFSLRDGTPEEGAARYAVAALSPQLGAGPLAAEKLRPASPASDTARFAVPAIEVPAAGSGTISATITLDDPGRYDRGVLMVTHEGAVVTVASLDALLQQGLASNVLDVAGVPAGSSTATLDRGLYHLEAWTWNSGDPDDTFERHPGADAADLRSAATATATVAIH